MFRDPIVEEVRQVRHQVEKDCEGDPQKFFEHIQEVQDKYRNRLVRRKPRPALTKEKFAM